MTLNNMSKSHNIMKKEGIFFFYSGYISQKVLLALGEAFKEKMKSEEIDITTSKKIFSVFVEQVQNIIRYSSEKLNEADENLENEMSHGVVVVGKESNGKFYISCGNIVSNETKLRLQTNLEKIKEMSKEEIKVLYKEKLKTEPDEHSKGVGIGFLEIARRSSEPIIFDFDSIDEDNSFFYLQTYIV